MITFRHVLGFILSLLLCGVSFGQQANFPSSSGGGITQVTVLPGSCTLASGPVQLTIGTGGIYIPVFQQGVCSYAYEGFSRNVVDASVAPYSVQVGFIATDCTFTSGQPTVVCTTTVPNANMVGWIYKATNGCCGALNHTTGVHEFAAGTILSVTPATKTFTLSNNALGNISPGFTNGSIFGAGPDMTTSVAAAWTAAESGVNCQTLQLPGGPIFIKAGQFNVLGTCVLPLSGGLNSSNPDTQSSIFGWGAYTTLLVLAEGFDFTTGSGNSCGGLNASGTHVTCFGGIIGLRSQNWGVTALSDSAVGGASSVSIFAMENDANFWSMACLGVGANNANVTGLEVDAGAQYLLNSQFDGCGSIGVNVNHTTFQMSNDFFGDVKTYGMNIPTGKQAITNSSAFNASGGGFGVNVTGNWRSVNDGVFGSALEIAVETGGSAEMMNLFCFTNTVDCLDIATGATASLSMSNLNAPGGKNIVSRTGTGLFLDLGGNTYTGGGAMTGTAPTCTFTSGGGTSPSCATQAGSSNEKGVIIATTGTGAPGSTGTITLTFAGTYVGGTGATPACTYTLDDSGTAWGNEAVARVSTQSTTAPVVAWSNVATAVLTALTVSVPYRIDYTCVAR